MSTSHFRLKELGNGGSRGRAAFETLDFYLGCFLRCSGYNLIDLRAEARRKVFVFPDRPSRFNRRVSCPASSLPKTTTASAASWPGPSNGRAMR